MNRIEVTASRNYDVVIGAGLLQQVGMYSKSIKDCSKAAIISDTNVWPVYGECVRSSLIAAGYQVVSFTFPAGEASKNGETYLNILNFLAENRLTRSDLVIALGGGVVGDITGFASATYLRGVSYIQIPTTLLAMVDSSVGGKTAIDLPSGKNLAGAFYQPSMVLCDTKALNSLPREVLRDGCAEVIKYGVLFDEELFSHMEEHGFAFDREYIVSRCVELKRDVVAKDEFDLGLRQQLNLGHTIGHSVELLNSFNLTHGQAVATGMAIVSRASVTFGICQEKTSRRIQRLLEAFDLPIQTKLSASELFEGALSDKKRSGGSINLVLPKAIGNCIIKNTPVEELESFIKEGL